MRKISWLLALAIPVMVVSCQKDAVQKDEITLSSNLTFSDVAATQGNGAPTGTHYNLNIIGVPNGKTADMTGNNGGRIFVNLDGKTKINLTPAPVGESFQVLDANGTDRNGATFQLPKDVSTKWTVWARIPGNQKGSVTITTCADSVNIAEDGAEPEYVEAEISCESITMQRLGYEKFVNVSDYLLYVTLTEDVMVDGEVVLEAGKYPLFDEALAGYFWDYDNDGLKILQLRFYPSQN